MLEELRSAGGIKNKKPQRLAPGTNQGASTTLYYGAEMAHPEKIQPNPIFFLRILFCTTSKSSSYDLYFP
jgi:hypothetical protein